MPSHRILVVLTATAVAAASLPPTRAAADAGDFIGGVVTGVIGSAIVNEANRNRVNRNNSRVVVRQRYTPASPGPSPAQVAARQQNREMQTALNYFGFPAGAPDGIVGRNTRAAVSGYQAFMGYPATGQITAFERDILMAAYNRGNAGSYDTVRMVSSDPLGPKVLLLEQREMALGISGEEPRLPPTGYAGLPAEVSHAIDEIAASSDPSAEQLLQRSGFVQLADLNGDGNTDYILDTSHSGSSFWCNDVHCKTIVFASTPAGYVRNDLLAHDPDPAFIDCLGGNCRIDDGNAVMASATPTSGNLTDRAATPEALPVFDVAAPQGRAGTLAAECATLAQATRARSGMVALATTADASAVLHEQFCLARDSAIANGSDLADALPGVTPAQVAAQCEAYGPALRPYTAALADHPHDSVIRDVKAFAGNSGSDPAQLRLTAEICLGHGYMANDMDTALGSALLLVALGEPAYGELVGHHLLQGYGAPRDGARATKWLTSAIDALDAGAKPVFASAYGDRSDLLGKALYVIQTGGQASIPAALPTYEIAE